jgi:hypothetical protein
MPGPPLLPEPLEVASVRVGTSAVQGGGDGLFATRDLPAGAVVAFYNGIRMTAADKTPFPEHDYTIVVEWEEKMVSFPFPWVSTADHMDLPPKYRMAEHYTATSAHKANHSFDPNCGWSNLDHPCYGLLPAIRTLQPLQEGEEVTVHYHYAMEVIPGSGLL